MMQLKKDYYALPEAAERSAQPIDDLLWLGEKRHIMFSVYANNWPIVWGDEREISYAPDSLIKIEDPIKPPFDLWQTGYLNLCWYDIHSLRVNRRLILSEVYAEKDGRIFVGAIQKADHRQHGKMHEFELELENVFISHEELQRVINCEAGDWKIETKSTPIDDTGDGRSARKPGTQAMYKKWHRKYLELKKKHPDKSATWIAEKIVKMPIARGKAWGTIYKNMKLKKVERKLFAQFAQSNPLIETAYPHPLDKLSAQK